MNSARSSLFYNIKLMALLATLLLASGCTIDRDARAAGGVTIQEMQSPSGARCYIIEQDGRAVGGNCL